MPHTPSPPPTQAATQLPPTTIKPPISSLPSSAVEGGNGSSSAVVTLSDVSTPANSHLILDMGNGKTQVLSPVLALALGGTSSSSTTDVERLAAEEVEKAAASISQLEALLADARARVLLFLQTKKSLSQKGNHYSFFLIPFPPFFFPSCSWIVQRIFCIVSRD